MSSFQNYLTKAPYKEEYNFDDTSLFSFHWANWEKTCKVQIEDKKAKESRLKTLESELVHLKDVRVWLKTKWKSMDSNLYSVYESYLDNRLRATWFNSKDEVLVSTNNEAGPYSTLKSMRWFDRDIYAKFVFRKLLTKPTVYRDFRLTTSLPIQWRLNGSPLEECNVVLHQISKGGILFKIKSKTTYEKIKMSNFIEIHFDFNFFEKAKSEKLENIIKKSNKWLNKGQTLRIHVETDVLKKHSNFVNSISSIGNDDYYLFMSYEDIFGDGAKLQKSEYFIDFVDKFKRHIKEEICA